MRILVTGANGYLGQGVVKCLLDMGIEVIATDFETENIDTRASVFKCDIFKINNPFVYFSEPDVLLHMAWRNGFVHYSDTHIDDLPNHYSFIKKMAIAGIKQIAVIGSMHEIGFYEGSVNENTPCHPTTPYGIGKNALRELTQLVCKQNDVVFQWLRGFYIVGNTTSGKSIFSKIAKSVEDNKKEFPFTLGKNQYDFLDCNIFYEQVAACVNQSEINGIINICSGYPEKLADRVERFIKENNYEIKLQYGAYKDRPYDSKAIWGDSTKIDRIIKKMK